MAPYTFIFLGVWFRKLYVVLNLFCFYFPRNSGGVDMDGCMTYLDDDLEAHEAFIQATLEVEWSFVLNSHPVVRKSMAHPQDYNF